MVLGGRVEWAPYFVLFMSALLLLWHGQEDNKYKTL